jgi:hypothetical protein
MAENKRKNYTVENEFIEKFTFADGPDQVAVANSVVGLPYLDRGLANGESVPTSGI